ncbi:MFS general substrate transporter [Marasmius fiardii PR-910]|nr:MFS general substrate transporter [Marasmius fiardii PR-910]
MPNDSTENAPIDEAATQKSPHKRDFGIIPIPKRLRYDPQKPPHFGIVLQVAFGFASTFTVSNLYYCQPILIELSKSFGVSYSRISDVPILVQAGYAIGLLLISPLGDLVRRRQLILLLVIITTGLTIGLAITTRVEVFIALSFLVGVATVTPQILIPLAADLAPPEKRASAISVVFAGLLLGVLIARVLSGIIAQYVTWRVVYYFAIGVQAVVLVGAYLLFPDYPAKNKHLTYWQIMFSMGKYFVTEPILVQAVVINTASAAVFTSFWVTLTFLLGGDPYNYSTIAIGLFGLVGICGVAMGPLIGQIVDKLIPWYATLVGCIGTIVAATVQVIGGGLNVSAVIIAIIGLDLFRQTVQTSLSTKIFSIAPEARSRLNAVNILGIFFGQVMGSSVGTKVFLEHGWRACAGLQLAWVGFSLFVLLLRGPHCQRYTWFGYEGGLEFRKSVVDAGTKGEKPSEKPSLEKGVEAQAQGSSDTHARDGKKEDDAGANRSS